MKKPRTGVRGPKAKRGGRLALTLPVVALLMAGGALVLAQYSVDWSTIDGGGGTSTGGVYTVTGTIGQPDASAMGGGHFTLQGGFWGIIAAVQTPDAPWLTVSLTTTNTLAVSWPGPEAGWKLQSTPSLSTVPVAWTTLPTPYQTAGTNLYFIEAAPAGDHFYRLHKP